MQILVVEDETLADRDLRPILEAMGHTVTTHGPCGEDLLRSVAALQPDLVLLGIDLHGDLDGAEAARLIRERHGVPVVFLTAHADSETVRRAARSNPLGYIVKPFSGRELRVTVELAIYKLQAEAAQRRRNLEILALSELAGDLLRCQSPEEAYAVIARAARRLFPGDSGALFIRRPHLTALQPAVAWGSAPVAGQRSAENCWAVRHGRIHTPLDPPQGCECDRHAAGRQLRSICVPLVAESETLGLLHIQLAAAQPPPDDPDGEGRRARLALALAEHAALGLANVTLRETLREQAIRDPLTGLYNRRYLEATLERELRRTARNQYPVGVIVLDIDHFKRFNDTYGHDAGDAVLRALGIFLLGTVRADDVVCRYGGEEFVLVLPSAPQDSALARAEQICASARTLQVSHNGCNLGPITVSLGVATVPSDDLSFALALARADAALYDAKRAGRDRAVLAPLPDTPL